MGGQFVCYWRFYHAGLREKILKVVNTQIRALQEYPFQMPNTEGPLLWRLPVKSGIGNIETFKFLIMQGSRISNGNRGTRNFWHT
jgi:hypothetical protein